METRDPLDEMLGASAPETMPVTPEIRRDLRTMNRASARGATPQRTTRRRAPRLIVGLSLAFALTGTAGAAAAGHFSWLPWALDPDVSYTLTLPSGRECEARIAFDPSTPRHDRDRFAEQIAAFEIDQAEVERVAAEIRDTGAVIVINPDGSVEDRMPGTTPPTDDGTYAAANYSALGTALRTVSTTTGVDVAMPSAAQFLCAAE
jgi:hypothetical protein